MRRKDLEMDRDFGLAVLDQCEYAVLAMQSADGSPYCIPISIVRNGDFIYFHCAKAGQKLNYMRQNPRVCLTAAINTHIVPEEFTTEYESAVAFGTAEELLEDSEKRTALRLLCERHVPSAMHAFDDEMAHDYPRAAVWRITLETVTAKRLKRRGAERA